MPNGEKTEEIYEEMIQIIQDNRMKPVSKNLENLLKKIANEKVNGYKNGKWF